MILEGLVAVSESKKESVYECIMQDYMLVFLKLSGCHMRREAGARLSQSHASI